MYINVQNEGAPDRKYCLLAQSIHSFINKYLSSIHYVPGTILCPEDIPVNEKRPKSLSPEKIYPGWRTVLKSIKYILCQMVSVTEKTKQGRGVGVLLLGLLI